MHFTRDTDMVQWLWVCTCGAPIELKFVWVKFNYAVTKRVVQLCTSTLIGSSNQAAKLIILCAKLTVLVRGPFQGQTHRGDEINIRRRSVGKYYWVSRDYWTQLFVKSSSSFAWKIIAAVFFFQPLKIAQTSSTAKKEMWTATPSGTLGQNVVRCLKHFQEMIKKSVFKNHKSA